MTSNNGTNAQAATTDSIVSTATVASTLLAKAEEQFDSLFYLLHSPEEFISAIEVLQQKIVGVMKDLGLSMVVVSDRLPQMTDTKLWYEPGRGYLIGSLYSQHECNLATLCNSVDEARFVLSKHASCLFDLQLRRAVDASA